MSEHRRARPAPVRRAGANPGSAYRQLPLEFAAAPAPEEAPPTASTAPAPAACGLQQPFANVVISASAGTGKTYELSNRYLALVHAGERPDHLIAATFARKAAGEILERVLVRLAEAATDPAKLRELAKCVEAEAGGAPLDPACCAALLRRLTAHLHRLRIGTLDSLFVQMAGTFGFELGLPPGWSIVDEIVDRRLRDAAIQEVLASAPASSVVTLMHLLNMGEVRRSVSDQVRSVADDLHTIYCETVRQAWECIGRSKQLDEAELCEAVGRLADCDGLPDHKSFAAAYRADVANAEAGDWQEFLGKGLAARIAGGGTRYYGKDIPGPLLDAYRPLIQHAAAVLIGRLADQTRATVELLEQFDRAYERLKLRQRALRFEDVTRFLARGLSEGRLGEVGFRMDLHACQLLLDEFQDTSLPQWHVLRPLAERAAREPGRSFFCVGDVKQAIYGWRGGVSELFDALGQQLERLEARPLDTSWRSSQPIIDVVNQVFGSLAACAALANHARVTEAWAARFRAHSTARDVSGYVWLETAPLEGNGRGPEQQHRTLRHAAHLAARLHREHSGRSIGILVRKNAAVARLIHELRDQGVAASEEGGTPLTDSAGVQLILSLVTLADHPGHTIARFHVARSPLGEALGFTDFEDAPAARRLASEVRAALVRAGYGRTVLEWVRKLAPACDARELSRLSQLVALAYRYESHATERPHEFVRFVETTRVEDPLSADVRVMTVHQAKGLEFDIVIAPELDGRLCGQTPRVLVGRAAPAEPINAVCRFPNAALRALLPARFQQMYGDWEYREINEDLCVLYVAMTRAIHALYLVIPPSRPGERRLPATPAGVLRGALCGTAPVKPETVLYEHGVRDWHARENARRATAGRQHIPGGTPTVTADAAGAGSIQPAPLIVRLADSPARRRRGLERYSPSALQGGTIVRLDHRLSIEPSTGADRGTLWHLWLEQIEWLDDGGPDDEALLRAARGLPSPRLASAAELGEFRRLLRAPAVAKLLCRSSYETPGETGWPRDLARAIASGAVTLTVEREQPFAIREDNALLTGAIDRLVLARRGGTVIAADVLDFKTDQIPPGDQRRLSERAAHYAPQIGGYRRAVAALYGLARAAVTARLVFLSAGVCVDVPDA